MSIKSINNFINGMQILSNYYENGLSEEFFFEACHDMIYTHVSTNVLTPESEHGQLLYSYGFDTNEDELWYYST